MNKSTQVLLLIFIFILIQAAHSVPAAQEQQRATHPDDAQPFEGISEHARLEPATGWPLWLKDFERKTVTEETSAISFVGIDDAGDRCFFLVDDIGRFHYCRVDEKNDKAPRIHLQDVGFDRSVIDDLNINDKWDFEALALDHSRRSATTIPDSLHGILSIEGRGPLLETVATTRLIDISLIRQSDESGGAPQWQLHSHGDALPGSRFWQASLSSNRGLEGLARAENYFTLGLESLAEKGEFNVHGTVIYLYNQPRNRASTIRTQPLGIHSITGLAAVNDSVTVILDRNRQRISVIRWEIGENEIYMHSCHHFPLSLPAPGGFRYAIASAEGIAVDDRGDIWIVTDPWRDHYQAVDSAAPETLHVYLAAEIPMIYRYCGEPIWSATGLTHLWD
jgi:hypothetical protein